MKKIKILSFFILIVFSTQEAVSQDDNNSKIQEFKELQNSLDGYYQIQVINSRALPTISFDLLKQIKEKRTKNSNSYISIRADIRVLVLGKSASPLYLKEDDKITYISE